MDVIRRAYSGSMISREAATSGQLSLISGDISDDKDVSNSLWIWEVEEEALIQDVGGTKERSVGFQTRLLFQASAWVAHGRTTALQRPVEILPSEYQWSILLLMSLGTAHIYKGKKLSSSRSLMTQE
jgi:hypothetical protein